MAIQHCHSAEKTSGSTMLNSRWREVIEREGDIRVVKLIKKSIQKRYNKNKVEMLSRIRNPHQGRDHRVRGNSSLYVPYQVFPCKRLFHADAMHVLSFPNSQCL